MNGVYTVTMPGRSVSTGPHTLINIYGTALVTFEVLGLSITNDSSTTSLQAVARLIKTTTDGTGTAATPEPIHTGEAAATITAKENYTAEPTKGNAPYRWGFNVLSGLWVTFPDRELPRAGIGTAKGYALEILNTISATTLTAVMTVREIRV
jgi:hypothetical protein